MTGTERVAEGTPALPRVMRSLVKPVAALLELLGRGYLWVIIGVGTSLIVLAFLLGVGFL